MDPAEGTPHSSESSSDALTRSSLLRRAGAAGIVLGGSGFLAACGSSSSSSSSSGTTNATTAPTSRKHGGSLVVGVSGGSSTETLDAHLGSSVAYPSIARCHQLYDTLAEYDHNFTYRLALAESIEANSTADVWTIKVKPGITFHNGKDVTAADVAYSIARIVDPKQPKDGAGSLAMIDIKNMKPIDKLTLHVPLKYAYSALPDSLAQYYNGIVPVGYNPKKPVGTGAFMYKSFSPGQQSVFIKNPHYWRPGEPYVDQLTIIDFPDNSARVNALLGGQVQAIDGLPAAQVTTIQSHGGLELLNSETGGSLPFTMRTDQAPFNDVRVRQAMRLMIDRPRTVTQALSGYGRIANDMWAPFDPGYNHDLPQRVQDVEQAKSLLKSAGQTDMTVTLNTTDSMAGGILDAASSFAAQLKDAGVNMKINNLQSNGFYNGYLKWPYAQTFWFTRNYIPQIAESELPTAAYNETHQNNPKFNRLFQEALRTVDDTKRNELINELMKIDYTEGGYIIWGFNNVLDAYSDKVTGFTPDKSGAPLSQYGFREVSFT